MADIPQYDVLLVGNTHKEEWSFLWMWANHAHAADNDEIPKPKIYPVQFNTTLGKIQFNFLSIPHREVDSFDDEDHPIYYHVDAAILMVDDSRFDHSGKWHHIPIAHCVISHSGDCGGDDACESTNFHVLHDSQRPEMTVFVKYKQPLLWLMQRLCKNDNIKWSGQLEVCVPFSDDFLAYEMHTMTLSSTSSRPGSINFTPDSTQSESPHEQDNISIADINHPSDIPQAAEADTEDSSLFILCIHCLRMILVTSPTKSQLVYRFGLKTPFCLATTACRSCVKANGHEAKDTLPYNVLKHTHMYDIARAAAGQDVEILSSSYDDGMAGSVNLIVLAYTMDRDSCVYGIRTDDDTIANLNEVEARDLWLGYAPGSFL